MAGLVTMKKLALKLMKKHKLTQEGWTFQWDHAKTRYGLCNHTDMTIQLSKYLTKVCDEDVIKDTILHEIAHALDMEENGTSSHHGLRWRKICVRIGALPNRLGPELLDEKRLKLKQLHYNYEEEKRYRKS